MDSKADSSLGTGLAQRRGSGGTQKFEHLAVELMTSEVFVGNVFALAIENAKTASEVPERVTPTGFVPNRKAIRHPGECHLVRCLVVASPLSNVNLHALLC